MVGVHGDQPVRGVHEHLGLTIPQSILYSGIVVVPIPHFSVWSVEGQVVGSVGCPDSTLLCLECRRAVGPMSGSGRVGVPILHFSVWTVEGQWVPFRGRVGWVSRFYTSLSGV